MKLKLEIYLCIQSIFFFSRKHLQELSSDICILGLIAKQKYNPEPVYTPMCIVIDLYPPLTPYLNF